MGYKIRPGITKINICGTNLLAAERSVWEECPRVRRIPRLWAACWAVMEQGKTDRDVVNAFTGLLHKSEEEVREMLDEVFASLYEEGYLIKIEDDEA